MATARKFHVELIKPSHYDDDGYVIQWQKAWIPSNSLACLYGIALQAAADKALGPDVEIAVDGYDETNTIIPLADIVRRICEAAQSAGDGAPGGVVCLVGVQSNQFPRAMDLARRLRAEGIEVAIGGFHVSGCLSMLAELPPDLQEAVDLGITLFAGEAEGRFAPFLSDVWHRRSSGVYNYMNDLPGLQQAVTPFLPNRIVERYIQCIGAFDAGRGCPFQCSFCTIINVQGRKSRWRDADDVERLVRDMLAQGVTRFFITDDNFARNRNWEPIFDRLIHMREEEKLSLQFIIQVDTLCHRIPNFIAKAKRAGCTRVFIGLENVNPENLMAVKKRQNRIKEYRRMLQAWRAEKVITYAGYILGFPADTPASIERDIRVIQRELPIDLLEFFVLTPLPGSEDHQKLHRDGVWMDPDMNKYDLEHVLTGHAKMGPQEWQDIYNRAWSLYYSDDHVKTLMRRARASGIKPVRLMQHVLQFHGFFKFERVHPLQAGNFRRKVRRSRRSGLPIESPLVFYPRRVWEMVTTYGGLALYAWRLNRIRKQVQREQAGYTDLALTPVSDDDEETMEMLQSAKPAKPTAAVAAE
ncbi:MAG: radical SAM protein [Rhodospirillaceae bacterium]|nr:radical SAM protein [Rhodospirillaceae bacterium]